MIKLNYDLQGKVSEIWILINEVYRIVPWNSETQSINWVSIENPETRNIIKSNWDAWASDKNLSDELADRPDLAPLQPDPQPNWNNLKFSFLTNPGYQRITSETTAILAVTRLETAVIDYVGGMNPTYSLFKSFWDTIINGLSVAPTQQEIDSWNAIALSSNMKFSFGIDGKMAL